METITYNLAVKMNILTSLHLKEIRERYIRYLQSFINTGGVRVGDLRRCISYTKELASLSDIDCQ